MAGGQLSLGSRVGILRSSAAAALNIILYYRRHVITWSILHPRSRGMLGHYDVTINGFPNRVRLSGGNASHSNPRSAVANFILRRWKINDTYRLCWQVDYVRRQFNGYKLLRAFQAGPSLPSG